MKSEKLKFNFQRLWNSEYPLVVVRIIEIVKGHQPEELHLKRAYDALAVHQDNLKKIEKQAKSSGFTAELSELDNLRDRITTYLFAQIQLFKRLEVNPYTLNSKVIDKFFVSYGYNREIAREGYTSQTENTQKFLAAIEKNANVQKAFQELHLTDLLTQLGKVNAEFEALFRTRNKEISQLPEIDIKTIRSQIDILLSKLFTAIDFCKEEYPDKNYQPLIKELAELLDYHKAQLKARSGKKKNN